MTAPQATDPAAFLDRLEETHQAATPGPWATYEEHGRDWCDEDSFLGIRSMTGTVPQVAQTHPLSEGESELAREDAAAIVAAHNHFPALIAAVRALSAVSVCQGGEEPYELHVRYCVPLAEQLAVVGSAAGEVGA